MRSKHGAPRRNTLTCNYIVDCAALQMQGSLQPVTDRQITARPGEGYNRFSGYLPSRKTKDLFWMEPLADRKKSPFTGNESASSV